MKFLIFACTLIAVSTCMGLSIGQGMFDRTLSVSGPVDLDIRSDIGGVSVTIGASDSIEIHAVLSAEYGPADLARAETNIRALEQNPPIEQVGDRVRIGYPKNTSLLDGVSMHLDIQAPPESQIRAHTTSGGIGVDGIHGPVQAQTHSGRIDVRGILRDVRAVTHSGAILIHGVDGPIFAQNDSGAIRIDDSGARVISQTGSGRIEISDTAGKIRATTHSGSIIIHKASGPVFARNDSGSIEAAEIAAAIDAQSGSGAIRLSQAKPAPIRARANSGIIRVKLASGEGYAIIAQSDRGRISIPEMKAQENLNQHHVNGSIGAGGPLVDVTTNSSNISIN